VEAGRTAPKNGTMDDLALAAELCPDDVDTGLAILRKMTPEYRASCERLIAVAAELNAGNVPDGVIVTRERRRRRSA
jgi:hypothetical protein